ncbi:MAG: adenylosuccinate lyase, partial [Clostridia bacterium]
REVLESLGLSAADHATQIVQPEFLLDYMHAVASTFGVLANLADDIRHLQRTEIGEVGEAFEADQVGSSTMPHKRNPWNFEHVKSLWKVFVPRMITLYMDQISEHQRDLTNSASGRFAVEMAAGLAAAADRLVRVVRKLVVDRRRMLENFESTAKSVIAEPLYILLAAAGHPDAHEAVRRLTLRAEAGEGNVWDLALASQELAPYLARLSEDQRRVLEDPRRYTGIAAERARRVCDEWERRLGL